MSGNINRRSVLAAIGASTTVGIGSVAGKEDSREYTKADLEQARAPYNSQAKAVAALQQHSQPILDQLEAVNLIPRASPSVFKQGAGETSGGSEISIDGVKFPEDSEPTARITARFESDNYAVKVFVRPQAESAHAIYYPNSDDPHSASVITADSASNDGFSTEDEVCCGGGGGGCAYQGVYCTNNTSLSCHGVWDEYEVYDCSDGSCYYGDHAGCCNATERETWDC